MRLAVYTDYRYIERNGGVFAERAFALFVAELRHHFEALTIVGRGHDGTGGTYRLPDDVRFISLPYYESLVRPMSVARALAVSMRRWWAGLSEVDVVWLLGPHPFGFGFAGLAWLRGRRVTLGVRQDTLAYLESRHPGRTLIQGVGAAQEHAWRFLARHLDTVVVGKDLEALYRPARVLPAVVSLIRDADIVSPDPGQDGYGGELQVLSVGRLEREKNPLLLADILQRLRSSDPRWRLVVCGEGPMREEVEARFRALGLAGAVDFTGYVPLREGLLELYRRSHVLLHVSLTEGVPQVLFEAFASGLPIVATDVGGVARTLGDAGLLVPPEDADAAARAVAGVASDAPARRRMVERGRQIAVRHTLESESAAVAAFIAHGTRP